MGVAEILGLLVVFVPSFFVSPGLVQKTFGARSPSAARWSALGNAAALAAFAFVPALFGMAMRAVEPGLANPELALPRLTTDVLPPWVGGLALAALFAAEISTADAVLFMLATSLSRDLFQAVLRPKATDAELLRVGRLAAAVGGGLGVLLALVLPSVASALKLFYGVMTAALFMPLVVGLLSSHPGAAHARVAIGASVLTTGALVLALAGTPIGAWLPSVAGVGAAGLVFATAWLGGKDGRPGGGEGPPAGPGAA
jgi:SSS family solute:Na+ symporter